MILSLARLAEVNFAFSIVQKQSPLGNYREGFLIFEIFKKIMNQKTRAIDPGSFSHFYMTPIFTGFDPIELHFTNTKLCGYVL